MCSLPFAIAALGSCCLPAPTWAQNDLRSKVEQLAKPYLESETVTGLFIGLIKGDQQTTVHLGSTGEGGKKPDDHTIYEIGSMSKVFTGLLLADAVVSKQLQLNDPAQKLLPVGVNMPKWKDREITLLEMSTHSSGLPRLSDNMPFGSPTNPYADYPSKLAHEFLNKHKLRREPGEGEYSNFAVGLLGHLLSSHAKFSYDELLKQRLTKPLGMNDTRVELTDDMRKRLATAHAEGGAKSENWDFADMPGAGGIRSSIADLLKFAKANLKPPAGPVGETLNLAWQEHRKGTGEEFTMGLGWHFARDGHTRWHNGQTGGYHSMLMVSRKSDFAVVLLTNTSTDEVDQLAYQLVQTLMGAKAEPRVFAKTMKVSAEVMKGYVGKYNLAPNFLFTVTVKDERLMVALTGQPALQVFAKSDTEWFYKAVDASLKFTNDAEGKCESLTLDQNGVQQTAKRIK
ncbi:MAG: serine hydrolase [Rubripirellula sp.]